MGRIYLGFIGYLFSVACSSSPGAPVRSPSLDYTPPAPATADGDTVGADRVGPGDQLQQGVTTSGPAPGWDANKSGLSYDPKQRVGGAIDPPAAHGSSTK